MGKTTIWLPLLFCFSFVASDFWAQQETTPSLGELARRGRERKKALSETATQTAESPGVGVRLVIPAQWKARDNPNPLNNQLLIDCAAEHPYGCQLNVDSQPLPQNKAAIIEADRKEWDSLEHFPSGSRHVSSREFQAAGRPAYEATFESTGQRSRYIHVLARDAGRLYTFVFAAYWDSKDHLDEYAPAVERVLESLSPLGQPTPQEVEAAELVAGFSPEERKAVGSLIFFLRIEQMCKETSGKYASIEQLLKGCQTFSLAPEDDPRRDPNYEYRVTARSDSFEVSVIPRRAGLGAFFSDGKKIYYNPAGPASSRDKVLGELPLPKELAQAQKPTTPAHEQPRSASGGKKVWTEEELRGLRGSINVTGGETSAPTPSSEASSPGERAPAQGEYRPEEELALQYICAFDVLEAIYCNSHLKRFCTVDELAEGVETEPGKVEGFKKGKDPRLDPNYEYRVTIRGDTFEVSAIPRKPGLGGFFNDAYGTYYNPKAEASNKDKGVKGTVNCVAVIRHWND